MGKRPLPASRSYCQTTSYPPSILPQSPRLPEELASPEFGWISGNVPHKYISSSLPTHTPLHFPLNQPRRSLNPCRHTKGVLSALDFFFQPFSLAEDTGIPPAEVAFGCAGVLSAVIRICATLPPEGKPLTPPESRTSPTWVRSVLLGLATLPDRTGKRYPPQISIGDSNDATY